MIGVILAQGRTLVSSLCWFQSSFSLGHFVFCAAFVSSASIAPPSSRSTTVVRLLVWNSLRSLLEAPSSFFTAQNITLCCHLLNRRLQVFLGVVLGRWLHSPLSTTLRPSIAYFSHTFQGALDFLDSSFIILTSDPFSHFSSDFCESQNLVSSLSSELLKIFSKSRWKNAITSRENESGRFLGTARAFFRLVFCWSDRFVYELFVEISVLPIFLQIYVLRSEMTPLFAVAFFFRSFWWNRFLQIASFSSENILCSTQNETSFFSWQKFTFFVILSEPAAIRDFLLGLLGNQRDLVKLISFPILHRCFQVFARLDSNRVLIFVIFCTANVFFLLKHEIHRFFFSKELFLSRMRFHLVCCSAASEKSSSLPLTIDSRWMKKSPTFRCTEVIFGVLAWLRLSFSCLLLLLSLLSPDFYHRLLKMYSCSYSLLPFSWQTLTASPVTYLIPREVMRVIFLHTE